MSLAVCEFDAPGGFVLCGEERRVVGEAVDTVVAGGFVAHVECFAASGCKGYVLEGVVAPDGGTGGMGCAPGWPIGGCQPGSPAGGCQPGWPAGGCQPGCCGDSNGFVMGLAYVRVGATSPPGAAVAFLKWDESD